MKTQDDKIELELQRADDECEGANYHSMIGMAGDIYQKTFKLVPEESRLKLAKAISKAVRSGF